MDIEKLKVVKERKGFIAALDQSGGSSAKTLEAYGIPKDSYETEEEMFDLIHEMRKRVFTSPAFTSDKILGSILFYKTMNSKVNDKYTADYLWNDKNIVSFLKVDKGLEEENNNCKLMKEIPDLVDQCKLAVERGVFGTKMRSVIYDANEEGIKTRHLNKDQKMFLAVTIHNIPEGLSVGVAFGVALANPGNHTLLMGALFLAVGIGIQNVTEGAAVSLPIKADTGKSMKAFLFGRLIAEG